MRAEDLEIRRRVARDLMLAAAAYGGIIVGLAEVRYVFSIGTPVARKVLTSLFKIGLAQESGRISRGGVAYSISLPALSTVHSWRQLSVIERISPEIWMRGALMEASHRILGFPDDGEIAVEYDERSWSGIALLDMGWQSVYGERLYAIRRDPRPYSLAPEPKPEPDEQTITWRGFGVPRAEREAFSMYIDQMLANLDTQDVGEDPSLALEYDDWDDAVRVEAEVQMILDEETREIASLCSDLLRRDVDRMVIHDRLRRHDRLQRSTCGVCELRS